MAIIALKQEITVTRGGGLDAWGHPLPGVTQTLKCRVDEGSHLIRQHSDGSVSGDQVTADARILLDKLADIKYTDSVTYTNELGETITRNPRKIDVKRNIAGKPILTEVYI